MVTISDKHFGELLGKAAALELAMEFAENQAEVIKKQEEASKAGMKRIKELEEKVEMLRRNQDFVVEVNKDISTRSMARARELDTLRGELALTKACEQRLTDELAATREQVEYWKQVVKDGEKAVVFWREKFTEKLSYSKALEVELEQSKKDVEYWNELFLTSRKTINAVAEALDKEFA